MSSRQKSQGWVNGVQSSSEDVIEEALSSCYAQETRWARTPLSDRKVILRQAANLLRENKDEFRKAFQEEAGAGEKFAAFNLDSSIAMFDELLGVADSVLETRTLQLQHGDYALVTRVPFGTVLAIAPWNAAVILSCRALLTPLLCGNCCVLKGSELTPKTHLLWGDLFRKAGLPDGVLNIIIVPTKDAAEATERLISDSRIRHINFTGSTKVGSIIGGLSGKYLKPVVLELGGKAPAIVLEDANLEAAASHCLLGGWLNQGQICMSTERVLVMDSVYDDFVAILKNLATKSGLARAGLNLVTPAATDKYRTLLNDAIDGGATLLLGDLTGNTPSILTGVNTSMRIFEEESFAHTFYVMSISSHDEAVELANASAYGLSSAVFTENINTGIALGDRLQAGATHINAMTVQDEPNVPHGGFKDSGFGRFNSVEGVMSFSQVKVITVHKSTVAHV